MEAMQRQLAEKEQANELIKERMKELLGKYKIMQKKNAALKKRVLEDNALAEGAQVATDTPGKNERIEELEELLLQSKEKIEALENATHDDSRVHELENQVENQNEKIGALENHILVMQDENKSDDSQQNAEIEQLRKTLEEYTARNAELESQIQEANGVKEQCREFSESIQALRAECVQHESVIETLQEQLNKKSEECSSLIEISNTSTQDGDNAMRTALSDKEKECTGLLEEIKELKSSQKTATEEGNTDELHSLVVEKENECNHLIRQVEEYEKLLEEKRIECTSLGEEKGTLVEKVNDLVDQLNDSRKLLEEKREEGKNLYKGLEGDFSEKASDLVDQLSESKKSLEEKHSECKILSEQMEALNSSLEQARDECEGFKQQATSTEQLRASLDEKTQECAGLMEQLDSLKASQGDDADAERRIEEKESECLELRRRLEDCMHLQESLTAKEVECSNLLEKLEALQSVSSEDDRQELVSRLAVAEAKAVVALEACVVATASSQKTSPEQEEKIASLRVKGQEWQKKASELAKRFKVLKKRYQGEIEKSKSLRARCMFFSLQKIERGFGLNKCMSSWKQITHAKQIREKQGLIQKLESELKDSEEERNRLVTTSTGQDASIKKLKTLLNETREHVESSRREKEESSLPPPGFDARKHILCCVEVSTNSENTIWLCVDATSRNAGDNEGDDENPANRLEWVNEPTFRKWMQVKNVKRYQVPEVVQSIIRRECSENVKEAEEQTAWAMSQIESLKTDLANYKRRAQIALKKAQEDAKRHSSKHLETENQAKAQLESELARITRLMDQQHQDIELLQSEKRSLDVALATSNRDLAASAKMYKKLEQSIGERMESMRSALEVSHEERVKEEAERTKDAISSLGTQLNQLEANIVAVESERDQSVQAAAKLEEEKRVVEVELRHCTVKLDMVQQELEALRATAQNGKRNTHRKEATRPTTPPENRIAPETLLEPENTCVPDDGVDTHRRRKSMIITHGSNEGVGAALKAAADSTAPRMERSVSHDSTAWGDIDMDMDLDHPTSSVASVVESTVSNAMFVEQLDILHNQHSRDRIVWQNEIDNLKEKLEELELERFELGQETSKLKEELESINRAKVREKQLGGAALGGGASDSASSPSKQENLTYLKNVVYKYMSAGEASERQTLLPVVATILQFSPDETSKVKTVLETQGAGGGSSWW
uniref:GRIP domain-containing protein n=1 Tax=Mucochytrium quahogii TaxID=96639 RepID=A0A7S2RVG3_9STRA